MLPSRFFMIVLSTVFFGLVAPYQASPHDRRLYRIPVTSAEFPAHGHKAAGVFKTVGEQEFPLLLAQGQPKKHSFGSHGFGGKYWSNSTPTPPQKAVTITLYMPRTGVYLKRNPLIFGPAFPDFKNARITGTVMWETLFYKNYAKSQTIKAVLWHQGKRVRTRTAVTDEFGGYSIDIAVNKKGSKALKLFRKNLTRRLSKGQVPPEYLTVPGGGSGGQTADPNLKKKLPTETDWKKSFWNAASKLKAIQKDYNHQKNGGIGTPNLDQWTKNHKAGRDNINALTLFIDLATGPATATAQIFEDANTTWKRLTGKPLPFVQQKSKVVKNALKSGVGFFEYSSRLKRFAEKGQ